jgi:hypothetical protein
LPSRVIAWLNGERTGSGSSFVMGVEVLPEVPLSGARTKATESREKWRAEALRFRLETPNV